MAQASVKVALRVRPLSAKEYLENCTECITFVDNEPQVIIGTDRSFTFDYVFSPDKDQNDVYHSIPLELVRKFIDGYNCTILAYGQVQYIFKINENERFSFSFL
jgi:kinesin family protein 4/21/27